MLQKLPKAPFMHFDISQSSRKLPVAAGAIDTNRSRPPEHLIRPAGDQVTFGYIARV
jgi:hypothetical protein